MQNKGSIDALHDLMPKHLGTKTNTNWKALINAIGSTDQATADLIAEVRQQFFVKTASRPYLDRLATNNTITRPKLVGMDDPSFRQYIPVLSYQPKQVKLIIDQLLDIFFFKESTTAYVTSQQFEPFNLQNGWEFEYAVDELNEERIQFNAAEFTDITKATANEIVAAINRQTQSSYATAEYDSITKNTYIRLFTNTIGSKGSIRMVGGRANVAFMFNGFITTAGNGSNTQWSVSKIGQDVALTYIGGSSPEINQLQVGDIAIINLTGNTGSFPITNVDLANQVIKFENLFATVGTFTQTDATQVKFLRPNKYSVYLNQSRAITWETTGGEITVEMPTSPPVVKRSLAGSGHINGVFGQMVSRDSDTSMTIQDATGFPDSGTFLLEPVESIISRYITPSEDTTVSITQNSRIIGSPRRYTYSSRISATTVGTIVEGLTQITVSSPIGIAIGQQVLMQGVPTYAIVQSVVGNIINIDRAATISASSATVSFLGNQLVGISPTLPILAATNEFSNVSISRNAGIVTVTTAQPHKYNLGEIVIINGSSGILAQTTSGDFSSGSNQITNVINTAGIAPGMLVVTSFLPAGTKIINIVGSTVTVDQNSSGNGIATTVSFNEEIDGSYKIESTSTNTYTFLRFGLNGTVSTVGTSRVERIGMAPSGSKVYITTALNSQTTRIVGPYMWDPTAPFVLSSSGGTIGDNIQAGKIVRLLNLSDNTIPTTGGGYLIFDYGLNTQEGPVRYLYLPTASTIAIDPSYTFKHSHSIGSSINQISINGPHVMSGVANEYPLYVTDPSQARVILEELIRSVKSAGIFVNFLVRYPDQLYGTLDVYNQQGIGAGQPFNG